MAREYPTLLDLVGDTPIVRLDRIARDVEPTLLAKLEYLNPGGSNKDRIGMAMIEAAERQGKLRPGGTIVEPTSGNRRCRAAIAAAPPALPTCQGDLDAAGLARLITPTAWSRSRDSTRPTLRRSPLPQLIPQAPRATGPEWENDSRPLISVGTRHDLGAALRRIKSISSHPSVSLQRPSLPLEGPRHLAGTIRATLDPGCASPPRLLSAPGPRLAAARTCRSSSTTTG